MRLWLQIFTLENDPIPFLDPFLNDFHFGLVKETSHRIEEAFLFDCADIVPELNFEDIE